jgi:hypothetical protein
MARARGLIKRAVLSRLLVVGKGEACERQLELWWLKMGSGPHFAGARARPMFWRACILEVLGLLEILPGRACRGRSPGTGGMDDRRRYGSVEST